MAGVPIRELMMEHLKETFQEIQTGAVYNYTVPPDSVERTRPNPFHLESEKFPQIALIEGGESKSTTGVYGLVVPFGLMLCVLDVQIAFVLRVEESRHDPDRPIKEGVKMLTDIEIALFSVDENIVAGTQLNVVEPLDSDIPLLEVNEPFVYGFMNARIAYRHRRGNPTLAN